MDVGLIKRFHIILKTLNCGYPINSDAFGNYTKETLQIYLDNYPLYSVPNTLHKILCHGAAVIYAGILPRPDVQEGTKIKKQGQ